MNSNRSYLDTLNLGRQRRPRTPIEDLNRTLDELENRFGKGERGHDTASGRDSVHRPHPARDPFDERRASDDFATRWQMRRPSRRSEYGDVPDIEREPFRLPEAPVAHGSALTSELRSMREGLHAQVAVDLRREFEKLRNDIENAYRGNASDGESRALADELARLSASIHAMSERSDDRGVNLLRLELEQVRQTLSELAREETVRSIDHRWAELGKRAAGTDPAIEALSARLEQIGEAVGRLPESLSLRSLEEKVRTLANAVDHFSRQGQAPAQRSFELIEERLDEISRAIVASAVAAQPYDTQTMERIEARISALAGQISELSDDRSDSELIERMNALAHRIDEVARQAALPERAIERLVNQVAMIGERLESDRGEDETARIIDNLERRFAEIASLFEERQEHSDARGHALFRDLDRRIETLAERLMSRQSEPLPTDPVLLRALDEKFADLSDRIEARDLQPQRSDPALLRVLDQRFADLLQRIEALDPELMQREPELLRALDERFSDLTRRIEAREPEPARTDPVLLRILDERFSDLSQRIEARPAYEPELPDLIERRLAEISDRLETSSNRSLDIDPSLIRSLESQVADLTAHLARPAQPTQNVDAMVPRLDGIERSLVEQRDAIISAARDAAENAVRAIGPGGMDAEDADALAKELHTLESLMRRSDERNSRTFEAIHDTLLKIVERLGTLETRHVQPAAEQVKIAIADAPSISPHVVEPATSVAPPAPGAVRGDRRPAPAATTAVQAVRVKRSPAEAAAEAALAAAETSREQDPPGARASVLGTLARKLTGRGQAALPPITAKREPRLAGMSEPTLDVPLDANLEDKPLEPGSGAPDLNAIMKRVRDERGQTAPQSDPAAAKADFIAAARRAAQAAAAEVETFKKAGEKGKGAGKFNAGEFLRAKRKPILMAAAAIMIALAGLQLGKAFLGDRGEGSRIADAPAASQTLVASAPQEEDVDLEAFDEADEETAALPDGSARSVAEELQDADLHDAGPDQLEVAAASPATKTPVPAPAPLAATTAVNPFVPTPVEAGPIALREAADAGDPKAMFEVGSRYAEGRAGQADMDTAAKWYERSAELGFAPAQYRIGNFLEKGIGVERDITQAKTWYQLAANQGNASAMHNLAVLFAMGADGPADHDSAARWFLHAAELGVKDSQFNLGILAAKGLGVPQNLEESYKWFAIAAKAGDKDASAKRDEVANALRPDQLAKARAAAELWKPKPVVEDANSVDVPDAWRESAATTASIDVKQAVRTMQALLNKHGYDAGPADGLMGQKTRNAIIAFQKASGLQPTGEIDEPLARALIEKE